MRIFLTSDVDERTLYGVRGAQSSMPQQIKHSPRIILDVERIGQSNTVSDLLYGMRSMDPSQLSFYNTGTNMLLPKIL